MGILGSPVNFVKISIGSKRSSLLAVAVASMMAVLAAVSVFVAKRSSAEGVNSPKKEQQGCCPDQSASPRRMIGTYYNTKDNWKSALVLNNKGPNPIAVTPILYSMEGEKFVAPNVNLAGESAYKLYFGRLVASAGPKFAEGSYEFTHTGRQLEVGASLRIVDEEKSLIFDEQLAEPGAKFSSHRAEAVYAVPYKSAKAVLILTNTTEKPFSISGSAGDQSIDVRLGAHQTQIIDLKEGGERVGSVSLTQTGGGNSALLAMVHVSEPTKGFSIAVPFRDPLKAKTNQIHGAGLRLGKFHSGTLTPVIAVRNVGEAETLVSATIPLSRAGKVNKIALPRLSLAPGETKLFNASDIRLRKIAPVVTAGLEVEYTGTPGSVVVSAMSVSLSGDTVFPLLMLDPQSISSSTGGYAWFAEEEYATTVYIKNVTEKEQKFRLDIVYERGMWGSNIRRLAPHETYAFDIKQIRDAQEKGSEGNTIPLDAESGHVYWTIFDSAEKALIGRAETVDPTGGMASTYECQACTCSAATSGFSTGFYDGKVEPIGEDHAEPGGTRDYRAMQRDVNCFGGPGPWFLAPISAQWSTGDPNIATVNAAGTVTAQNPGTTSVWASWTASTYQWNPNNEFCDTYSGNVGYSASFTADECQLPTGEVTSAGGWDLFGTRQNWFMILTPNTGPWVNRRVYEQGEFGPPIPGDTCWFQGSEFPPFNSPSNTPDQFWTVNTARQWGPDTIGYGSTRVTYYRQQGKAPCGTRFTQFMFINCGSQRRQYKRWTIGADIGTDSVSSLRADAPIETRTWP